ncbi:hypothetical protein HQQ81_12940 [Microbacteriaceae bacterium VKM Ac-2854]|nr:hypothetical protein [Microbacteriaceae bacterium VKM Ac-2854]
MARDAEGNHIPEDQEEMEARFNHLPENIEFFIPIPTPTDGGTGSP